MVRRPIAVRSIAAAPSLVALPVVAVVASVLACAGCIETVPFDPSGDEVTLSGGWQLSVNGAAQVAADPARCARADFATVQLVLINWATEQRWEDDSLRFPCGAGAFDSRPMAVLETGNFHAQWVAHDVAGAPRQILPRSILDVEQVQHGMVETGVFELFDATGTEVSLEGGWQVVDGSGNEVPPDMRSCGEAAIDRVRLELFPEEEPELLFAPEVLTFPCTQGAFRTDGGVLARGRYGARWAALSRSGVVLARAHSFTLDASASGHVVVPVGVLRTRRTTGTIVVEPRWEHEGSYKGCGGADVQTVSWALRGPDGCVDCPAEVDCPSRLRFEDLGLDVYTLELTGSGPNGSWTGECTLRHGSAGTLRTECEADRLD